MSVLKTNILKCMLGLMDIWLFQTELKIIFIKLIIDV